MLRLASLLALLLFAPMTVADPGQKEPSPQTYPESAGLSTIDLQAVGYDGEYVTLRYEWTTADSLMPHAIDVRTSGNVTLIDEPPKTLTGTQSQNGTFRVSAPPDELHVFAMTVRTETATVNLTEVSVEQWMIADGEMLVGDDIPDLDIGPTLIEAPLQENGTLSPATASSSSCTGTMRVTVRIYIGDEADEAGYRPDSRYHDVGISRMGLEAFDGSGQSKGTTTTDDDGWATFDIPSTDCTETLEFHGYFEYDAPAPSAAPEIALFYNNLNPIIGYTDSKLYSGAEVSNQFYLTPVLQGAGILLTQGVQSYEKVAQTGVPVDPVRIYWTNNEEPSSNVAGAECASSCYVNWVTPQAILIDGAAEGEWNDHTIFHEYGHQVHNSITNGKTPPSNVGIHCGSNPCHYWNSVHETTGSALTEGWAEFFVGVARNTAQIRYGNLDDPQCTGPFRECSAASALWKMYDTHGIGFNTIATNVNRMGVSPEWDGGIHALYRNWIGQQSSFATELQNLHIVPSGEMGPNDDAGHSMSNAPTIAGTSISGSGSLSSDTHNQAWDDTDRRDAYRFYASYGSSIRIDMTPREGNYDLYLYRPDSTANEASSADFVANANGVATTETIQLTTTDTG